MQRNADTTVHASCVLAGRFAVLIRGPSGSGKSRLALALIERAGARLVADDRVRLIAAHGRLVAAVPDSIAGKIEIRGFGIRTLPYEPLALVGLIVDLADPDAARMPEEAVRMAELSGVKLSRLPVAAGKEMLPPVLAAIHHLTQA